MAELGDTKPLGTAAKPVAAKALLSSSADAPASMPAFVPVPASVSSPVSAASTGAAALASFSADASSLPTAAPQLAQRVAAALEQRRSQGTLRALRPRPPFVARDDSDESDESSSSGTGATVTAVAADIETETASVADWRDLSGNDYLRLSRDPRVVAAAIQALKTWGVSASASPLISGYTEAHHELETTLCAWSDFPHALVWNTGYAANQAVLSALPQRGDVVLADRLIHNSMITGLVRSGARLQRYRHCDLEHLETLLRGFCGDGGRTVFVVTESVFSMDGDYPDLRQMAALKARYGFFWVVDEAHALGWYGQRGSGLAEHYGVSAAVDLLVGTLGKGLGAMGAYTLFHDPALREYLINFAGEFIYSTYLPPSCASAATAAVACIRAGGAAQRERLHALSRHLRSRLALAPAGDSPIVPVAAGIAEKALVAAERLRAQGFAVGAVRPPTVPEGGSRLRLSLHAQLDAVKIDAIATAVEAALR